MPVFHPGELEAQRKAGTRGVAAELLASQRNELNFAANHDAFLAAQSFALVTSVHGEDNCIWVTPLFGKAGDITALSESEIFISASSIPRDDVLLKIKDGSHLSMLGIDLMKRTRHRINGRAQKSLTKKGLHFKVELYSPNCPKYINRRELHPSDTPINTASVKELRSCLSDTDMEFVKSMDTLWIGTYAPGVGADTNHRGGRPGFIRVTSNHSIEWPEYRGNGMFYTSGNLELYGRAGVTLMDFSTGSMIQLTGRASVDWNHDGTYEGATRVISFEIERVIRTDHVTNHRWQLLDYSAYNPRILGHEERGAFPTKVTLAKIVQESPDVKTFRWLAQKQITFLPGQYATFEFHQVPHGNKSEVRTWTISETPNSIHGDNTIDISVKRAGLMSKWLHDHAKVGMETQLNGVQGDMTALAFHPETRQPMVPKHLLFLSAGIGITPMMAMIRGIGAYKLQHETNIAMIHVERTEESLLWQSELKRRVRTYPNFSHTNIITNHQGRLTQESLRKLVPSEFLTVMEVYLCGPLGFMTAMIAHLVALGIPAKSIHTENFDF